MTTNNRNMYSRALSFALGLVTASFGVLISHFLVHLVVYGDGYAPALRFFSRPGIPAGIAVVVSLLVLVAVLYFRQRPTLEISGRTTFVWALVATLVVNVAPLLGMTWSERGGEYFVFGLFWMSVMTTPIAIVMTLILTALVVEGYKRYVRRKTARGLAPRRYSTISGAGR